MLKKIKENIKFILWLVIIFFGAYVIPRAIIILATPFVYKPQTFNVTNNALIETSVFDLYQQVVIRTNVSDTLNQTAYVWMNLTSSNGTLIYNNALMTNTSISCGVNCSIWNKNYTLAGRDPAGTWIINVTANDTTGNKASNSTTFSVNAYVSIGLTTSLAGGITFGNLDPNTINASSLTCNNKQCNISVSSDTNVNVDIMAKINAYLTRQGGTETIQTHYWNSSTTQQPANPAYQFSTSYDYTHKVGSNLPYSSNVIFNSWLTIATGQVPGVYNNTIYYCADEYGKTNC